MRWAPLDCRAPTADELQAFLLPELRFSASRDEGTHGRKLYAVFAVFKDDGSYIKPGQASPINQEIVKESWVPEEVKDDKTPPTYPTDPEASKRAATSCFAPRAPDDLVPFSPYARKDGKLYHAAKRADLFIMYKLDPETPGTDQGWVYGTVTADGKRVTSAGRVESCMKCHQAAPHDRLFGLPPR
jgi:hypothetical protein